MKKAYEMLRKIAISILSAVGIVFGALALIRRNRIGKLIKDAETCKNEADELAGDARIEAERQRQRIREAEANAQKKDALDKRLDKIKEKHIPPFVIIVVGIILIGLFSCSAKANEVPLDYDSLKLLYFATLDRVVELKTDLEETIQIAEGYRNIYETEKRLREEAEEAVSRGLIRESQLQDIIEKQHGIILKLAGGKTGLTITSGVMVSPSTLIERHLEETNLFLAFSYTF